MDINNRQNQLQNTIWNVFNRFHGTNDPMKYKDYFLVTIFLKYISDLWRDHSESYRKQFEGNEERIRRRLDRERFVIPEGASFYDLYENRDNENLGELINTILNIIERRNKTKLAGLFRDIDFCSELNLGRTKERNKKIKLLLEDFAKPELDLGTFGASEEVIGNVFSYLIEKLAANDSKKVGEFYTPMGVSSLVAKLAKPKEGDTICDPACGFGGLLIEVASEVGSQNYALYGMELNHNAWAIAYLNMFMHNDDSAMLEWCHTFTNPQLREENRLMKFNVVVANPPLSLERWIAEETFSDKFNRFWRGIPPKSKSDYAFISHMIEVAIPKEGRVVVVVPHGVLSRGGVEGKIRQKLIEENLLDAVVGLPEKLFLATGIPVVILVFDRSREKGGKNEKRKNVLFIDASQEYETDKNHNLLSKTQINKIVSAFEKRKEITKYAHLASFEELKGNNFILNIPRYIDTFTQETEIDTKSLVSEIARLEIELAEVRSKIGSILMEINQ